VHEVVIQIHRVEVAVAELQWAAQRPIRKGERPVDANSACSYRQRRSALGVQVASAGEQLVDQVGADAPLCVPVVCPGGGVLVCLSGGEVEQLSGGGGGAQPPLGGGELCQDSSGICVPPCG
jgi:hypothetical protein